jgi:hypothetical protein
MSLKPMSYSWSYLACKIAHSVPIQQPSIGSSFQAMPVEYIPSLDPSTTMDSHIISVEHRVGQRYMSLHKDLLAAHKARHLQKPTTAGMASLSCSAQRLPYRFHMGLHRRIHVCNVVRVAYTRSNYTRWGRGRRRKLPQQKIESDQQGHNKNGVRSTDRHGNWHDQYVSRPMGQ